MFIRSVALSLVVFALSLSFSVQKAEAKQCIYNDSATSLNVTWYNGDGKKAKNASNSNLTFGYKACLTNKNLGFATVKCNGCAWAAGAAKAAVIVGGTAAFGVCVVATAGECVFEAPLFAEGTAEAVRAIPPSFKGKLVVVPNRGKTTKISGNAFGLKVN